VSQNNLEKSTLGNAALLMLTTRLLVNILSIVSSLVLVRLLSPQDFGIAAIAMSVYAFVSLFGEFGLNTALIQKTNPVESDYDTAFTINFLFGLSASLVFWILSDSLAAFFEDDRLALVFSVLGLLFIINGALNVKTVTFQIDMDFKQEMKLQVFPKLLSFMSTMGLALCMESYWALILGSILASLYSLVFSYWMLPFIPKPSTKGAKSLFGFSKWLMLNNILLYLNTKSIDLIVGKVISTRAAGIYSISKEMSSIPSSEIAAPINKASFPAYSRAKNDVVGLRKLYYETKAMITIIALPASMGLFVAADFFVPVVLGEQWLESVSVIMTLSVVAFLSSLTSNNNYVFLAIGKPYISSLLSAIRFTLFFVILYSFKLYNTVNEPAIALGLAAALSLVLSYVFLRVIIGVSIVKTIGSVYRPLLSSFFMAASIALLKFYFELSPSLGGLLLIVLLGIFFYCFFLLSFWVLVGRPVSIEQIIMTKLKQQVLRKV